MSEIKVGSTIKTKYDTWYKVIRIDDNVLTVSSNHTVHISNVVAVK